MAQPFREAKSGNYFVSFSLEGKRYKRSTGSRNLADARRAQGIIGGRVSQLKAGLTQVPEGVTVEDFIFEGRTTPADGATPRTPGDLIDR